MRERCRSCYTAKALVDSTPPPPPVTRTGRQLRPWYLVVALLLTWIVGVCGLMSSCSIVSMLRQGSMEDVAAELGRRDTGDPLQAFSLVLQTAHLKSISAAHKLTFPLNTAKLLLSGLLVIMSGLAMGGRPGVRGFALQAVAANAAFAALDYALTRNVRAGWIEEVARAGEMLPTALPQREIFSTREFWWWLARARLIVIDLGVPFLAAIALTRARTRMYFDAMASAAESAEEP